MDKKFEAIRFESQARMPASCRHGFADYVRIAVMIVESGFSPKQGRNSKKARVQYVFPAAYAGKTEKCAAAFVRREADDLVSYLNAHQEVMAEIFESIPPSYNKK